MTTPSNNPSGRSIHLPTLLYWIGFWLLGIYLFPLIFFLVVIMLGLTFDATIAHSILSGIPRTIALAAVGSFVSEVIGSFSPSTAQPRFAPVFYQALFWGTFWTVIFFSDKIGQPCATGIDASACDQLHVIALFIVAPILFLYYGGLGLLGNVLGDALRNR